ncbi:AcrR family transcriptional regulator [Chitinivorax tropicus]|uniref:AcrR family transcriptional regulator n=1 Tax=Chitinivorax tropicus TaxID=714531 RepID=A0A840MSU5_9PROT|nr:TetR/AcrR family transcriptional regulator [Chitinivorax tropicus]MBB5020257.1 AcrR family transcriptional regulator [Chitinivorax tropicus]
MTQEPATGRWSRRKQTRPSEIIEAALDLFVERGFAATKIEDIAKRAGVTRGTPYLYFASKEELFKAVIREGLLPRIEVGEALVRDFNGPATALLEEVVRFSWQAIAKTKLAGIAKLVMAEAGNFPDVAKYYHDEVVHRGQNLVMYTLEYGVKRGEFRPMDIDYTMRVVIAPIMMAMIWQHSLGVCINESIDDDRFLDSYLSLLKCGLCQRID